MEKFSEFAAKFNVSQYSLPILLVEQIANSESDEMVFKTAPASRDASLLSVNGRQPGAKPLENATIVPLDRFERSVLTGISIGRAKTNKICLSDNAISKMHASIKRNYKGQWQVVDVESENKSRLNGKSIETNKAVNIENGDGMTFADTYHCTFFTPKGFQDYLNSIGI